jgi:hypothetical protein
VRNYEWAINTTKPEKSWKIEIGKSWLRKRERVCVDITQWQTVCMERRKIPGCHQQLVGWLVGPQCNAIICVQYEYA